MASEKVLYSVSQDCESGQIVVKIDGHRIAELAAIVKLVQLLCPVDIEQKSQFSQCPK